MMATSDECRVKAFFCERQAKKCADVPIKQQWEELAIQWHFMANRAAQLSGETSEVASFKR
jgi:hypothetical protein